MSNSPFILFVRSATMLAMMVVILLIAVFWNGLPSGKAGVNLFASSQKAWWKSFFQQDEEEPAQPLRQEIFPPSKSSVESEYDVSTKSIIIGEEALSPNESEPSPTNTGRWDDAEATVPEIDFPEEFITLKKRLEQEHDATEILLEPWGNEGKMYRFSCYIPHPNGSGVKRLHQSIQPTPLSAIQNVMEALK